MQHTCLILQTVLLFRQALQLISGRAQSESTMHRSALCF